MDLSSAAPEEVGMSSGRLLRARDYAQRVGDSLGSPGGAALVVRRDRIVGEWYWGKRGLDDERPFDANTMVCLASVTKGVTATALSLLVQDGLLWLDEPAHLHLCRKAPNSAPSMQAAAVAASTSSRLKAPRNFTSRVSNRARSRWPTR